MSDCTGGNWIFSFFKDCSKGRVGMTGKGVAIRENWRLENGAWLEDVGILFYGEAEGWDNLSAE